MQRWKSFPRFFLLAVLLIGLLAGISAPAFVNQNAKAAPVNAPLLACPDPTIAQWTFLGNVSTPATGSGIFSNGSGITGPAYNGGQVIAEDPAISFTGWDSLIFDGNDYVEFAVASTGRIGVGVSFKYRGSNTGPANLEIHYSTDGINFIPFGSPTTIFHDTSWNSLTFDLSSITALNNNSNAKFRLYAYGATDTAGTLRFDNVTFTGTCVAATGAIIINEVAWAGTRANEGHEWIELYNPGLVTVDLAGWILQSTSDTTPLVTLTGTIPVGGYYLLERDTDNAVFDIPADQIYSGALSNVGESLALYDASNVLIDTANGNGGVWPAGSTTTFGTMERNGTMVDSDAAWFTNVGVIKNGLDFNEDPLWGTPKNGNSPTPTPTSTPTTTNTSTPSVTPTITGTRPTPTRTGTATRTATPNPPLLTVIINEVAWMGTIASTSDEWIELYNPGSVAIDLTGWVLRADDESPFITWNSLDLTNVFIQPGQYYLLERTDDTTVTSFTANKIYSNALDDSPGDVLKLFDAQGRLIDTANSNGGDWPAGVSTTTFRRSMERTTPIIQDGNASWATFAGTDSGARDANNGIINGTPGFKNWVSNITLTPSRTPTATRRVTNTFTPRPRTATPTPFGGPVPVGRPFINEFLPRPGFDWNLDGKVDTFDEFIELKNVGNAEMNLSGWRLDDSADFPGALSSAPYTITDLILKPGEYAVFYASQTNILLSDGGDSVRLFDSSGDIMDVIDFTIAKVEDESVCRLPDGNGFGSWFNDCTPTPNLTNSRDGQVPTLPEDNSATPFCALPDTLPEDFLFAECRGYGANIWDNFYWDEFGWMGDQIVPENKNKWKSFIE